MHKTRKLKTVDVQGLRWQILREQTVFLSMWHYDGLNIFRRNETKRIQLPQDKLESHGKVF